MSNATADQHTPAAPPPRGKLLAAWVIDFAVVAIAAWVVGWATYSLIIDSLRSVSDIGSIGISNLLSSHGDWQQFGVGAGADELRNLRLYAVAGLVAVVVVAAGYFWVAAAFANRTLGMAVVDLRLGQASAPSTGPGRIHSLSWALLRAVTDIGLFAAACVAPMFGAFAMAFLLWLVAVAWLAINGFAALTSGRSVVDRLGAVVLVPAQGYAAAAQVARAAAGAAAIQAQNFAGQAQTVAGQIRENAPDRVQQSVATAGTVGRLAADRTRQAIESERATQAADASKRAAKAGLRIAGDVKRRFNER